MLRRERDHISLSISTTSQTKVSLEREIIDDLSGHDFPNDPSILWVGVEDLVKPIIWRPWEHGDKLSPK